MTEHRPGPPAGFPPRGVPPYGLPAPGFPAGEFPGGGPGDWRQQAAQRRELVIVGAHGGAGTTTLAILLAPAWDMGALRPGRDARYPALIANGRPLLLVCRNTAAAATAATTATAALTQHGAPISVLVVVSDGWPEPATATARFRLLEPRAGAIIRVPFIPAFRVTDDPAAVPLPGRARRALNRIAALTGRPIHPQ